MRLSLLCEWFWFDSHLSAFHFGSSLIVVLVKGLLFYLLQMFQNFMCSDL